MIALSQLEDETLWNMTKTKRLKFLIDNVNELGTSWCFSSDDRILKEISYLDDLAWNYNLYNFRDEQFESAAKMFIYLNLCPKFMFDWIKLYVDLLQNASPDIIVLTLNRILIIAKTRGDEVIRNLTKNMFLKVTNILSLKFQSIDEINSGANTNIFRKHIRAFLQKTKGANETITEMKNITSELQKGSKMNSSNQVIKVVSNHPVHIYDEVENLSPSALIPFCDFGRSKSTMGNMMENFELPVCDSFKAKVLNDKLCYEVDLHEYRNDNNIGLKSGLVFFMDYNEDRQVILKENDNMLEDDVFVDKVDASLDDEKASIYLNTIGEYFLLSIRHDNANISEPLKLVGEGKYNLNAVKEIKVTDSYLGLDMKDKGCQNEEPQEECITRHFISTLLKDCGCLPLKLTGPQNVRSLRTNKFN